MLKMFSNLPINRNLGLLVIRLGIGLIMLVAHGYGKLTGGTETWAFVGTGVQSLGIGFAPAFWGFMAAFAEFVCSILIVLGVLFRPAVLMLAFTMLVAVLFHLNLPPDNPNAGWSGASHALAFFVVYIGLFLTGPGKYAFSLLKKKEDPY
jgi:putative oxidoreductase